MRILVPVPLHACANRLDPLRRLPYLKNRMAVRGSVGVPAIRLIVRRLRAGAIINARNASNVVAHW